MEFYSLSFLSWWLLILITILMVVKMMGKTSNNRKPKLPPGPWKLPIIGNMHQMVGSQLPHHKLRDLAKKYGPLMHIQLGEVSSVVVSSAEMAKEVMKKHDLNFAYRPSVLAVEIILNKGTDIAFSPYGEYWRQLRKICTVELLSTRRVHSFRPDREDEMMNLVDWISCNGSTPINLTEKLFSLGYTTTSRVAFGKKNEDRERFSALCKEAVNLGSGFHIGDVFPSHKWLHFIGGMRPKLERLRREADKILTAIIEDHQHNKNNDTAACGGDLVDVLLKCMENDELGFSLTLDNIKSVIFDMFIGGSDSTATTVAWAMAEMMKNPRILNKAQTEVRNKFNNTGKVQQADLSDLPYLQLIIKETLRFHPPLVLLLPRECQQSCEIGGFIIPSKTKVIINAWAIGRDPVYWKDPDNFHPERFIHNPTDFKGNHFEYIPFGAGRRICPGLVFGMAGVEYQLATLLFHFDWQLFNHGTDIINQADLDMTEAFGSTVRQKNDLYLIPTPYQPPTSS